MQTPSSPPTLTLTQVAEKVGVSRPTLYKMIEEKRFPVRPIKGTAPKRWNADAVEAWKKTQAE